MWQQLGVGTTESLLTVVTAVGVYLTAGVGPLRRLVQNRPVLVFAHG